MCCDLRQHGQSWHRDIIRALIESHQPSVLPGLRKLRSPLNMHGPRGVPRRRQGHPDPQQLRQDAAGVFNGTVGTITALSLTDRQLTVRIDEDEDITYDFDELDELQHAYAITVHRSQGSEYPGVVMPLTMSSYTLLQRNLLYTAVTRGKRLVALAIRLREPDAGSNDTSVCTSPA